MSQLPDDSCSEPLDTETYRRHALLLKSLHCARPVEYQGRNEYIHTLTVNRAGGGLEMPVYLAGNPMGIDSAEIKIKTNNEGEKS